MEQRDSGGTAVPLNIITAGRLGVDTSHLQRDIAFIQQPRKLHRGLAADANENPGRRLVASAASRLDGLIVVWLNADQRDQTLCLLAL